MKNSKKFIFLRILRPRPCAFLSRAFSVEYLLLPSAHALCRCPPPSRSRSTSAYNRACRAFFELSHLLMHPLAPAVDKFEALVYSRVALDAPVNKLLYLFYGHTRLFQALYNRKPLNILVFEHSYSAARALDKRQKPLFVIISECRGATPIFFAISPIV